MTPLLTFPKGGRKNTGQSEPENGFCLALPCGGEFEKREGGLCCTGREFDLQDCKLCPP
jgi:hypothetical protein